MKELEDKISALEKRIEMLETIVKLLGKPLSDPLPYCPPINVNPLNGLCNGGLHDFPMPWFGVNPPSCRRCGFQPASNLPYYTVTSASAGVPKDEAVVGGPLPSVPPMVTTGYIAIPKEEA